LLAEINEIGFWEFSLYVRKVICLQWLNKDFSVILFSFFRFPSIDYSRKRPQLLYAMQGGHIQSCDAEDNRIYHIGYIHIKHGSLQTPSI
jgi:hypothetical protein